MIELVNLSGEPVVLFADAPAVPATVSQRVRVIEVDRLKPPARLRETALGARRAFGSPGDAVPVAMCSTAPPFWISRRRRLGWPKS